MVEEKKREMTGIEYAYMVDELNNFISGKRLQKFQKIGQKKYRMRFEKYDIICEVGIRIHITKYLEETEEPDNFTKKIKKELIGKILKNVKQLNNDRILLFNFGDKELIFEMFRNGNVILTENGKIIAALSENKWATREIKIGENYKTPPPIPQKIEEAINDKPIITSLIKISLGKNYATEILKRCGIDEKESGNNIKKEQLEKIKREMEFAPKPVVFLKNGKSIDYALTDMSIYNDAIKEYTQTLSEAADRFYWENKVVEEKEELIKLKKRLEKQKEYLQQLKEEEKKYKEIGDWFYTNYEYAEKIIKEAKEIGINNIDKLIEKHTNIKSINKEKKMIEIEL
ncbi:MAG: NFACT family protein [Candidatus Bilamarchaeaceae archaeon]